MYFKSNAKIEIFKRLPNLDFEMTQNEKFYPLFFFYIISTFLVNYYNI